MTPITREDLEYAAKAAGYEVESIDLDAGKAYVYVPNAQPDGFGERPIMRWFPPKSDGDCARMCAAVGIDTEWEDFFVYAQRGIDFVGAAFTDHANDKCAAWRYASVKLAAAVGRARS